MSKPPIIPAFATDDNYPAGSDQWSSTPTKVMPDGGESAAGLVPNEKPPAQILNGLLNWLTLAALYVIAGILDDDVEAPGFATRTYNKWIDGTVYAVGDIVLAGASHNMLYQCTIAGTSGDGTGGANGPPIGSGSTIVDGSVTWKFFAFTGYRYDGVTRQLSPASGVLGSGFTWDMANGYAISTGAASLMVPIDLSPGHELRNVTFEIYGDGSVNMTSSLLGRRKGGAATSIVGTSGSAVSASWADKFMDLQPVDLSVTPWEYEEGDSVWLVVSASAANLRVGEIRVTEAYPTP